MYQLVLLLTHLSLRWTVPSRKYKSLVCIYSMCIDAYCRRCFRQYVHFFDLISGTGFSYSSVTYIEVQTYTYSSVFGLFVSSALTFLYLDYTLHVWLLVRMHLILLVYCSYIYSYCTVHTSLSLFSAVECKQLSFSRLVGVG
jgi:hypothetical protein